MSTNPIPSNIWRAITLFCAQAQGGQIVLHIGQRHRVELAVFSETLRACDEGDAPPPSPLRTEEPACPI